MGRQSGRPARRPATIKPNLQKKMRTAQTVPLKPSLLPNVRKGKAPPATGDSDRFRST